MILLDKKEAGFLLIILICLSASFIFFMYSPLRADERIHYDQIINFSHGKFTLSPYIAQIPGYHYFMAGVATAFNLTGKRVRSISFIISVFTVLLFFFTARKVAYKNRFANTLLFSLMPILFPFFFLIYTDVMSLFFVLLAFYLMLNEKYTLTGISGIISCLIRQDNIVWLGFIFAYILWKNYEFKINRKNLLQIAKELWVYLLGFSAFLVFVITNKGFAIADKQVNPAFSFHLGNVYFMLFLFFFLFLPYNISKFKEIAECVRKNRLTPLYGGAFFITYILTFINNHPFNIQWTDYFLRHWILVTFSSNIFLKSLFFIPVFYSVFSLFVTRFYNKYYWFIYPFTLLYVTPHWLIEQRYYIIPFSLFVLFSKRESKLYDYITIISYFIISLLLLNGIKKGYFFL